MRAPTPLLAGALALAACAAPVPVGTAPAPSGELAAGRAADEPPAQAQARPDPRLEWNAVQAVTDEMVEAERDADLGALTRLFTEDAVLAAPGAAPRIGREQVRAHYRAHFTRYRPRIRRTVDERIVFPGWAFERGQVEGHLVDVQAGDVVPVSRSDFTLLRKDTDGVWRIARRTWCSQLVD